jgi:hypothetical protein
VAAPVAPPEASGFFGSVQETPVRATTKREFKSQAFMKFMAGMIPESDELSLK